MNMNQKPEKKEKKLFSLVYGSSASYPQKGRLPEIVQLVIAGIDNTVLNGRVEAVDGRGFGLKFVISITSGSEIVVGKVLSCMVYKVILKKKTSSHSVCCRSATKSPSKKKLGK
jgi:hypothetical protein